MIVLFSLNLIKIKRKLQSYLNQQYNFLQVQEEISVQQEKFHNCF